MWLAYDFGIYLYGLAIKLAGLFNPKAAQWAAGRKHWKKQLQTQVDHQGRYVWIHCASLGEFEQGRPVIEALKGKYPQLKIALTFFSPSGFNIRKDYPLADLVTYMPLDTRRNARTFIELLNPRLAIFVKYEVWPNHLAELSKQAIPTFLISAIFHKNHLYFRPTGRWYRKSLEKFTLILTQDADSAERLKAHDIDRVTVAGDTRFDRVVNLPLEKSQDTGVIGSYIDQNRTVVVCGSTWPQDEHLLLKFQSQTDNKSQWIIAPHEINSRHLKALSDEFGDTAQFYSKWHQNPQSCNVLIIDQIGLLNKLYRLGTIAYIGGGFGTGIHNVLEAATYGKPVIFGPNYQKFKEARDLIKLKGAFSVASEKEATRVFKELLQNADKCNLAGSRNRQYVVENAGATPAILAAIDSYLNPDYALENLFRAKIASNQSFH